MDRDGVRGGDAPAEPSRGAAPILGAYLVALAIGEGFAAAGDGVSAILVHLAVLFSALFHAATLSAKRPALARFLMAMGLAPTLRVLSLSVPFWRFTIVEWLAIMAVPLLAACVAILRALPLRAAEAGLTLGPPRGLPGQAAVALVGVPLGAAEYLILRPEPWIPEYTAAAFAFAVLALALATGLAEELIFRGILQRAAAGVADPSRGIPYVTAVFAILHLGSGSVADVGFAFLVGLLFAWIVRRTGTLVGVVAAHTLINVTLYLVAPLYA